jgi:hypothetical protein
MGEKVTKNDFKATFNWLLNEEAAVKIMNGEYGVGDRDLDHNNISKNIAIIENELAKKVTEKAKNHIESHVILKEEDQSFKEYIKTEEYLTDEDPHNLKAMFRGMSKYQFLNDWPDTRALYSSLRDSYIMKRHIGITSIETTSLVKEMFLNARGKTKGLDLLKKLKESKEKIEQMNAACMLNLPLFLEKLAERV